jgi:hypothetical protein
LQQDTEDRGNDDVVVSGRGICGFRGGLLRSGGEFAFRINMVLERDKTNLEAIRELGGGGDVHFDDGGYAFELVEARR